jgi:cytochrome b561
LGKRATVALLQAPSTKPPTLIKRRRSFGEISVMATAYALDPVTRYNAGARLFHAVIAILIVANLALGLLHEPLEDTVNLMPLHKSIGLSVLALSIARLLWRVTWKTPAYDPPIASSERALSKVMHWTLYALMVIMPLSGWIFSSAGKYPIAWLGIPMPKFALTKADPIVGLSHEAHEVLGYLMIALVLGHALAALRHHFVLKDGVLRRMW